jgi:hypothetical protein
LINKITPTGSLDQENDYPYIQRGDYRDALDVTAISDSRGNTLSWEPKTQQQYAFNLGEIVATRPAKWKVTFAGQDPLVSTNISLVRPGDITIVTVTVPGNASGATMATSFFTSLALDPNAVVSIDPLDPTSVFVQYQISVPWDLTLTYDVGNITLIKLEDPIDASMYGPFVLCGGKELGSDLFMMSTTSTKLPETFNITAIAQVGGLVRITLDRAHGIYPSELVFINGVTSLSFPNEWIVSAISESNPGVSGFDQITLALSAFVVFPVTFSGATVISRPRSLSQISVATEDINSGVIGHTSLLITNKFNFRTQNRIHLYCEEEGFRKSFYWCDGNNKDRCMYYTQDSYVTDGFLDFAGGDYNLSDIETSSRLQLAQIDVDFSFDSVNQSGGALLSGNYRYAIRFLNEYFTGSEWSDLSNIINIYSADLTVAQEIHGDIDGTLTTKSVLFNVSSVPSIYKYYEVAYVRYSNNSYFADAFRGELPNGAFTVIHTGRETSVPFNIDNLNAQNVFYETSHSIDALDNRLIRSNLISEEIFDFSDFFKTLEHQIQRTTIDNATFSVLAPFDGESFNEYRDPFNVNYKKTFMPNETYRFSARVKLKNGKTIQENFWIDDIIIDDSATNTGNVFNDNRRIAPTWGPGLDWTDNVRNPYVYYVTFSNINWDYIINGRKFKDIVEKINIDFVEMTEQYKEVLATGVLIGASSVKEDISVGGDTASIQYGKSQLGTDWGPWTGFIRNSYWQTEVDRYKWGAANWYFDDTSYWVISDLIWTARTAPFVGGYYAAAGIGGTPSLDTPDNVGLVAGQKYWAVLAIDGPFIGVVGDITVTINGNTYNLDVANPLGGQVYGDSGYYVVGFVATADDKLRFSFNPSIVLGITLACVITDRLNTPQLSVIDLELYHRKTNVSAATLNYNLNNKAGFFVSPDIHFNQQGIQFLPGDQIINQKQLRTAPNTTTPSFYDRTIGTRGTGGGCFSESVYDEWLYDSIDTMGYLTSTIDDCQEILPFGRETVGTYKLSNNTNLFYQNHNANEYYTLPKCLAVVTTTPMMEGYIWDSGMMRCQYYRPKGKGAKFGAIDSSVYVYSGFFTRGQSTVDVYGDLFVQNTFTKLRTPSNGVYTAQANSFGVWGWGLGTGMYSYNRGNYQMEYVANNTLDCPPSASVVTWLENKEIYFGAYTNGYSNRFDIKSTQSFDPDVQVGNKFPTRICYSNVKPNGSFSDEYRTFLLLNFRDLNLSDGEIVHHENGNGELLTWQRTSFQRQFFNSSGLLQDSSGNDIVVGDAGALTNRGRQISSIGTTHKWSIAKGRSQGGNDNFVWVNTDLGEFVRFGLDGTVPIAQVKNMMSSLRDKVYWATDKYEPSADLGIRSVWDDTNKCWHFVVRGARETAGLWDFFKTYTQPVSGDLYVYVNPFVGFSVESQVPEVYRLNVASSTGVNPLIGSSDWVKVDDVSMFNIDFSMLKSGFQSFHTWLPKTMLKWNRTFVSARPNHEENKIYIHNRGGVQYAYPGAGQIATNPYITPVCVLDYNTKTTFDAVELNSSLLPDRIDFTTEQHVSYLTTAEFEQDEIHDDLWAAPIKNDSTVDPVYNPLGVNDVDTSFLFGQYLLAKYKFNPTVKSKLFNFIIKLTPMSRLNNS